MNPQDLSHWPIQDLIMNPKYNLLKNKKLTAVTADL